MDRHHRKQLLDRPTVGNRLEQRKIAEISVGQQRVEPLQFLGHEFHLLRQLLDLVADGPEQILGQAPLIQRQVAAGEQVHRHVERLLGVVIAFQHVAHVEVLVRLEQVEQRLLDVVGGSCGGTSFSPWPDTPSTLNTSTL